MTETNLRRPVALIGCNDEWMGRSLESVFAEKGYDVTRTGSGKQSLKLARRGGYDVLMLDEQLNELSGVDVCLALRDDPLFDHAIPIVIISSSHRTRLAGWRRMRQARGSTVTFLSTRTGFFSSSAPSFAREMSWQHRR